jgi:RHS repeat-associated protein
VYVWVSNESENTKVWFDDLKVTHRSSRVTQATDYYAWGNVMRENKSPEDVRYRYGYQGQFAEKDEETGWNHFELREYDAVIGRWLIRDPLREFWSPYLAMGNNPISMTDPRGGQIDPKPGDINKAGTHQWGLNATTGSYEWSKIMDELVIVPKPDITSFFNFNRYFEFSSSKRFNNVGFLPVDEKFGYSMVRFSSEIRVDVYYEQFWNGPEQPVVEVSSITLTSMVNGGVDTNINVNIYRDGKLYTSSTLKRTDVVYIKALWSYDGRTKLTLPKDGTVHLEIIGGYSVKGDEGRSVPIHHPILNPTGLEVNHKLQLNKY